MVNEIIIAGGMRAACVATMVVYEPFRFDLPVNSYGSPPALCIEVSLE